MSYTYENYDVAVIGAGHAGCEAALACARLGLKTIVFTVSVESIALMPCNPNIGGSSKGHLVREIDALGACAPGVSPFAFRGSILKRTSSRFVARSSSTISSVELTARTTLPFGITSKPSTPAPTRLFGRYTSSAFVSGSLQRNRSPFE